MRLTGAGVRVWVGDGFVFSKLVGEASAALSVAEEEGDGEVVGARRLGGHSSEKRCSCCSSALRWRWDHWVQCRQDIEDDESDNGFSSLAAWIFSSSSSRLMAGSVAVSGRWHYLTPVLLTERDSSEKLVIARRRRRLGDRRCCSVG